MSIPIEMSATLPKPILASIAKQMEALVEPLEKVSGKKFEMAKLKEAVRLSRDCSDIWKKILDTASAVPAPLTFFDGTTLMGPAVVGRGTQKALDVLKNCWRNWKNGLKMVKAR